MFSLRAHAGVPPASAPAAPNLRQAFPEIRRQLASPDFAQRQAGQKLLDALPPSQLDPLRALAQVESDPEVKARLENRIDALELFLLTNPPALSVHLQNGTLDDVRDQFKAQLGTEVSISSFGARGMTVGGVPITPKPLTLQADHRPFWEIIYQLHRQSPITITAGVSGSGPDEQNAINLRPATGTPTDYRLVDSFLVYPEIVGTAAGDWSLRLKFMADPRVRIIQHSAQFHVAELTDQDGKSLLPLVTSSPSMSNMYRPDFNWLSNISLTPSPGLKSIKDLRATIDLAVAEKQSTLTIDLTKPFVPIETSRGTFTIDGDPAGKLTVRVTSSADIPALSGRGNISTVVPAALWRPVAITLLDKDGKGFQNDFLIGTELTVSPLPGSLPAAKVLLRWPESSRLMPLNFELRDIPIPVSVPYPAANPRNMR